MNKYVGLVVSQQYKNQTFLIVLLVFTFLTLFLNVLSLLKDVRNITIFYFCTLKLWFYYLWMWGMFL